MAAAPTDAQLRDYIGYRQDSSSHDDDIASALATGIDWVEQRCGPFTPAAYDVRLTTSGGVVAVPVAKPATLTSVTTHKGAAVTVEWFDEGAGTACLSRSTYGPWRLQGDHGWTAGAAPDAMHEAALIVADVQWRQRRRATSARGGADEQRPRAGMPHALTIIAPYAWGGGG